MEQKISTLEKKITIEDLSSGNVEEQKASPEFGVLLPGWKTYKEFDASDSKTAIRYKVEPNGCIQLAILNKNHSPRPRIVHMVLMGNKVRHADYGVVKWGNKKKGRAYVYKDIPSNPKYLESAKDDIKLALAGRGKNYYALADAIKIVGVK